MSEKPEADLIQNLTNSIIHSNMSHTEMTLSLANLESVVEVAYELGLTQVKPVRLMTADDLVS